MVDVAAAMYRGQIVAVGSPPDVLTARRLAEVFDTTATIAWDDGHRVTAQFASEDRR
jgi:ABC-type cobalamin/Fe3+-siderophores transport system ATPase subunit